MPNSILPGFIKGKNRKGEIIHIILRSLWPPGDLIVSPTGLHDETRFTTAKRRGSHEVRHGRQNRITLLEILWRRTRICILQFDLGVAICLALSVVVDGGLGVVVDGSLGVVVDGSLGVVACRIQGVFTQRIYGFVTDGAFCHPRGIIHRFDGRKQWSRGR